MTYVICHLYNMTLYVIYDILSICHMTHDINDICQYGCLKKPQAINNPASECKFIYNLILNYIMKFFRKWHFLSIILEILCILDSGLPNHKSPKKTQSNLQHSPARSKLVIVGLTHTQ